MLTTTGKGRPAVWAVAIVAVSAVLGLLVDWRAPGIARYAHDRLVRARGPLPAPDDIAIVAIDEPSIARFGRFPWSRQVLARTLDAIAAAQPKVIAVDVLFADPTQQDDDDALARSAGRAGNVVVAAQLIESPVHGGPSQWLLPLASIRYAAAGVGHVNVQTESDGAARQIEVRASDDAGQTIRALAVEAVRVADGTPEQGVQYTPRALLLGPRTIPLDGSEPPVLITRVEGASGPPVVLHGGRMTIDFIGPAGSFAARTYSVADVVEGSIPADRFRGKFVLIGATAGSMSDRIASPFVHETDPRADQHGALMPGVEVLANEVNTILRGRFYSEFSGWAVFLWTALIAAGTLALLDAAQGSHELLRQIGALAAMATLILLTSYAVFTGLLTDPPLVPATVAFATAATLGLMRRSIAASARLDSDIAALATSSDLLPAPPARTPTTERWLPHGLEWKARMLGELNGRLLERARFVDSSLRSVEDGILIAAPDGAIRFANRAAAEILASTPQALAGQNLFERLPDSGGPETLGHLVEGRARLEREIATRGPKPRHFILRMAAIASGENGEGPVLGIVASLSDITRQQELQQTKNDVISLVSHEMRTPLTAIQGMTELLAAYELDPERRREMHVAINDEVKRLARMIGEYLDITRLESGATVVRPSPLRLETVVERVLLLLDAVAAQRGIRIVRQFAPDLPALVADADLLSRAVENLVSNAIKYSPPHTEITVSATCDGPAVLIAVRDQGYGIPEGDLARIFDKFYRVPRVQDAGVPGTGLGLALVREIAGLHGGTVSVKSELNSGSTFTLRLPRQDVGRAMEQE
jgi:signal transduction histidine kinase